MSEHRQRVDALRQAIRGVVRGGDDAERKQIVERSAELGLRDLLPDNWNADGTLKRADHAKRETANDVFAALTGALEDAYSTGYDSWYVWVQDWDGGNDGESYRVIYSVDGDLLAAPFTFDDAGKVQVDVEAASKVRPITNYVERKSSNVLEWRKRKVESLKGLERREFSISTADLEIREADDGDMWKLSGFASVTDRPYEVGFYTETIQRGAFKRTLGENPDVQLLINHEGLPLARTRSGTLRLEERDQGLWVDADLDKLDPDAQRLNRKMQRGDIDQMSFAFQVTDQDWNDDFTARSIRSVSLHRGDVSVVNQGANDASTATIRSREALQALGRVGGEAVIAAFAEWRDHTLLSMEARAGKTLSASSMDVLTRVLELVSSADDAVDEAQPLLADLMGVPNPDADDEPDDTQRSAPKSAVIPDYTTRARQSLLALERAR